MTRDGGQAELAILFPGQGVGDAIDVEAVRERRPDLVELAGELVGGNPFEHLGEGTRYDQPAIYCASVAALDSIGRPRGSFYAGHSLGELAALAAAGAVDDLDGLRIAAERGRLMDAAATAAPAGGMLAVGGDRAEATALARRTGLALANENSPSQFVLTGRDAGLERARAEAKELGLRVKRLAVAGAFHSVDMEPAVEPFRAFLAGIEFRATAAPVVSSVTATPFGPDPRDHLAAALVNPVRWVGVLHRLQAEGAQRFLDVGPGKVLAGLVRRTLEGAEIETAKTAEVTHV